VAVPVRFNDPLVVVKVEDEVGVVMATVGGVVSFITAAVSLRTRRLSRSPMSRLPAGSIANPVGALKADASDASPSPLNAGAPVPAIVLMTPVPAVTFLTR